MRTRIRAGEIVACVLVAVMPCMAPQPGLAEEAAMKDGYQALVELFEEWRAFERPPLRDGAV